MKGDAKDLSIIFLRPGELFLSDKSNLTLKVTTVLGSCISVILYNPRMNMSAMCHAVMPFCEKRNRCEFEGLVKKKQISL